MEMTRTIKVDAPPDSVWSVLADVERWPEWTPSVGSAEFAGEGPLRVGAGVRLRLRGAPGISTWRVTRLDEGSAFAWEYSAPGIHTVASHGVQPENGASRVTLGVRQEGPGTWVMRPWLRYVNRRNLKLESEGLKRAAEARSR
jgi:hypothetical protein